MFLCDIFNQNLSILFSMGNLRVDTISDGQAKQKIVVFLVKCPQNKLGRFTIFLL